jgi:RNA polymerase sigma factor (sigma-70 family)
MLRLWNNRSGHPAGPSDRVAESHEDIFIQRYEWLLNWSLHLTHNDIELAEDLVQDAFIQFTLARPDLAGVQNLEGYLYRMVRNLYLSRIRRGGGIQNRTVSIIDYDSAELGLRAADPQRQIQAREELLSICSYACVRKERSKAGSVLILRYFHGYYPGEIAYLLQCTRRAVDDWLRIARREVKHHLECPRRFSRLSEDSQTPDDERNQPDFIARLRESIFRSRRGRCLTERELREIYEGEDPRPAIPCATVAHIVSCRDCLEAANRFTGVPPFWERHPIDTVGSGSRSQSRVQKRVGRSGFTHRRRLLDVHEHAPQELRVSVNGFVIGSQRVGPGLNEQRLKIDLSERVGFAEVFSEQGIRLIYLDLSPPPEGAVEQSAAIELSGGRSLELSARFGEPRPSITVTYNDPSPGLSPVLSFPRTSRLARNAGQRQAGARVQPPGFAIRPRLSISSFAWWLRPAPITGLVALILVAAFLLLSRPGQSVSAAELLRKSIATEESMANDSSMIIHTEMSLEARREPDGTLLYRRQIETWRDSSKGVSTRRVYNERRQLLAGEWTTQDGGRVVYRRGEGGLQKTKARQAGSMFIADDAWQLDLSAKEFSSFTGRSELARVANRNGVYLLRFDYTVEPAPMSNLLQATLGIRKTDLHPIEQELVVKLDDDVIRFRFTEMRVERVAPAKVPPHTFEVDPALVSLSRREPVQPTDREEPTNESKTAPLPLAMLEVDALYRLHGAGACLREQPQFERADGSLSIQAVVDTESRKAELEQILGGVGRAPSVNLDIITVAQAAERQTRIPAKPGFFRRVEISSSRIPIYEELRMQFSERLADGSASQNNEIAIDGKIRQFANRVLNRSSEALMHAWVLRRYIRWISPADYGNLDYDTREKWRTIIREHLVAVGKETGQLLQHLKPIFFSAMSVASDEGNIDQLSTPWRDVELLFQMASANDKAIRAAFSISPAGQGDLIVKSKQFRDALIATERLAAKMRYAD